MVSAEIPDWSREQRKGWDPGRALLASIRSYQGLKRPASLMGRILRSIIVLRYRWWSIVTGADIPPNTSIGGGLLMPHPNGIVIHPDVEIGPNCLIFQQVTLGTNGKGVPFVEGHVDIGAGAKLLGPIRIGAHARIGANAVVLDDVPPGATVVGIPARVIEIA